VKRLALFWLLCAAIGFAIAAAVAIMLALAVDHGPTGRSAPPPSHQAGQTAGPAAMPSYRGRRLLGD
jgi:ABC-type nitrate/sulfonate/bicarbonate transport system permease component